MEEKQIEEMARDQINGMVKVLEASCDESQTCICACDLCKATALYNAGCRMQREGEWIVIGETEWIEGVKQIPVQCSECSISRYIPHVEKHGYHFCNSCGARMKGVNHDRHRD